MGRPKGTKYRKAIALRLEDELWDAIERMAKAEERSLGSMARIVLREGLEAREAKSAPQEEPEAMKTRILHQGPVPPYKGSRSAEEKGKGRDPGK